MDVSCHSFIRMAKLAAPLMTWAPSGSCRTIVPNYNVMGPVKAALEATCRYLAFELGPQRIRIHPISAGPLQTRAASGLKDFDLLLNEAAARAPLGEPIDIMDVGFTCAYPATPLRPATDRKHGLCRRWHEHPGLNTLSAACVACVKRPNRRRPQEEHLSGSSAHDPPTALHSPRRS
jgi:hypothetical protein